MKITRLERTVVSVPFLPGILPSFEYQEFTSSYPEPLSHRNQDIVRIYTDAGLISLGMSGPYYGELEDRPPDLIGKNPLHFEPRTLGWRWLSDGSFGPDWPGHWLAAVSYLRRQITGSHLSRLLDCSYEPRRFGCRRPPRGRTRVPWDQD